MPKKFPLFIDLTEKKVVVYGAGVIASHASIPECGR